MPSEKFYSLAEMRGIRDRLIYIFSFSKAYAMTGWRIAYLATHQDLAKKILGVHDALVTCAPVVSQYAALAALEMADEELAKYHAIYKKRRDLICRRLDKLKNIFEYQKPDSAYFVFPRIKEDILQKIAPGGGFEAICDRIVGESQSGDRSRRGLRSESEKIIFGCVLEGRKKISIWHLIGWRNFLKI